MTVLLGQQINTGYYTKQILTAKNTGEINKRIVNIYKKCNNKIRHIEGSRASQLLNCVLEYKKASINIEMILAGYTADSIIFEKE